MCIERRNPFDGNGSVSSDGLDASGCARCDCAWPERTARASSGGRRLAAVSGLCTSLCAGRAAFSTELPWCIGGVQRGIGVRERVGCVGRRLKHA
jgi:hypothetical protein